MSKETIYPENHGKRYTKEEYIKILSCLPRRPEIKRIADEMKRSEHGIDYILNRSCDITGFLDGRKDELLFEVKEELGVLDQIVIIPSKYLHPVKVFINQLMKEEKQRKSKNK